MLRILLTFLLTFGTASLRGASAELTLDPPLMDHAVIQQGVPFDLSGSSSARTVTVRFRGKSVRAPVADGRWHAKLPALDSAPGSELRVTDGTGRLVLDDVAVGEVIFCSGQSNMAWPVSRATGAPNAELIEERDIRLLRVPLAHDDEPRGELPDDAVWTTADRTSVDEFSAVCWYTAEQLYEDDVPMGLVQSAWGGSQIEAWLPEGALADIGRYDRELELLDLHRTQPARAQRAFGQVWEEAWAESRGNAPWTRESVSGQTVPEMGDWKDYGDPEAADHFGHVWFTKRVDLSTEEAATAERIRLGLVDDIDATWVNGQFLGSTFSWSDEREYELPSGLLKPGENIITVNVLNGYGQGGLLGPETSMFIEAADGTRTPIGEGWHYELVKGPYGDAPQPPWSSVSGFSTIHNAMVAPLRNMKAGRAIWYQGESNTSRPSEYEALLGGLIGAWQGMFGEQLESVVVQLPDFGARSAEPGPSGWAGVREAQRATAEADPKVGLVVTIDAGDVTDIHPANKKIIAERVARTFRHIAEQSPHADGSGPRSAERRSRGTIAVSLPRGDYQVLGARRPTGVALCEEDSCRWTDAELVEDELLVEIGEQEEADTVRYCWADAPICNLYRADDVPVTPFEIRIGGPNG